MKRKICLRDCLDRLCFEVAKLSFACQGCARLQSNLVLTRLIRLARPQARLNLACLWTRLYHLALHCYRAKHVLERAADRLVRRQTIFPLHEPQVDLNCVEQQQRSRAALAVEAEPQHRENQHICRRRHHQQVEQQAQQAILKSRLIEQHNKAKKRNEELQKMQKNQKKIQKKFKLIF